MKADRINTLVMVLGAFVGLLALSTGNAIVGAIMFLFIFGMLWNRGTGNINERIIYENEVKSSRSIEDLYELIKDMKTPLGAARLGEHKGDTGQSIIFGPGPFKDCVIISKKGSKFNIKHITKIENISRGPEDEHRFENIIDTSQAEVNPENYSEFAKYKLLSVMMIRHLRQLLEKMETAGSAEVPSEMDMVNFYYHNSGSGWFKDEDGREVLRAENGSRPFLCSIYNDAGEEMASVKARKNDAKGYADASAGFDITANGEQYGEIYPLKGRGSGGFRALTPDGEFVLKTFPACRRANIAVNYRVERGEELKAVIGGSPRLVFNDVEERQNDLVLSYDDDYLVLYAILELFIMTYNSSFLK